MFVVISCPSYPCWNCCPSTPPTKSGTFSVIDTHASTHGFSTVHERLARLDQSAEGVFRYAGQQADEASVGLAGPTPAHGTSLLLVTSDSSASHAQDALSRHDGTKTTLNQKKQDPPAMDSAMDLSHPQCRSLQPRRALPPVPQHGHSDGHLYHSLQGPAVRHAAPIPTCSFHSSCCSLLPWVFSVRVYLQGTCTLRQNATDDQRLDQMIAIDEYMGNCT
jgi:hypothetical protein